MVIVSARFRQCQLMIICHELIKGRAALEGLAQKECGRVGCWGRAEKKLEKRKRKRKCGMV